MDGPNLLAIILVVALIITIIIILIVVFTLPNWRFEPSQGEDEIGPWVKVSTPIGIMKTYIFNSTLQNNSKQYLDFVGQELSFGQPIIWNYNGQFLSTLRNNVYYYVSLDPEDNTLENGNNSRRIIITTEPITSWIFDGYQIILTVELTQQQVPIIDPQTLQIGYINRETLYLPSEPRWLVENIV